MANRLLLCERRINKNWLADFNKYNLRNTNVLDFSGDLSSLDDAEDLRRIVEFSPYEDDYKNTCYTPITQDDCCFLKFTVVNDYIVVGQVINGEQWLDKNHPDYFEIVYKILEKNFQHVLFADVQCNPTVMDIAVLNNKSLNEELDNDFIFRSDNQILFFGAPRYIDWLLRKSERLFLI